MVWVKAGYPGVTISNDTHYGASFNNVRAQDWDALQRTFPETPDLHSIMQCTMGDEEDAAQFILRVQEMWRVETGTAWDQSTSLFYFIIKRGLPKEVQKALDKIAGIEPKGWPEM